ncbi:DNA cytosine methyltransferase [Cellulomonas gilvus]|uniref:Cytosine-specific methyltransferase n=1 Tax=Cellulomonas gilvus (strain ATCC 13127 / NRRL B-14078) TaxID=593907 RepID=F8A5S1_CELGA|nr:DNA cytosine methyltransferase [Cellulomonas gilvus]AEI13361.1 DNA-cytosine methyltransferase [Cellulomonas gilvus ATCC 13127]
MPTEPAFRFVDLFAGIGGFAAALTAFGGKGVYSVEIDRAAAKVYELNWGHSPLGDITQDATDSVMNVPAHDVLAAGFPCQPFSKSGAQRGMDETRGTLYWNILNIVQAHHPSVVLLENVRNLAGPRHRHEWQVIVETLRDEGYRLSETPAVFSPHQIPPEHGGRPQVRERVFITATYDPDGIGSAIAAEPVVSPRTRVGGFDPSTEWSLDDFLDEDHHVRGCDLSVAEKLWIDAWDDFVQLMWEQREGRRLPGFPLWADAWPTTAAKAAELAELIRAEETASWKRDFLVKNAAFYDAHRRVIDQWAEKWGVFTDAFPPSRRKLEWQAQDTPRLWDTVMHLRPSGIRAKRPTYLPALVAITQTSIIGPRERRLSPREAARLQGLPDEFTFGTQPASATYRQLGNGVNVGAVWNVLKAHVARDEEILKRTAAGQRIVQAVLDAPSSPDQRLREILATR